MKFNVQMYVIYLFTSCAFLYRLFYFDFVNYSIHVYHKF